MNCNKPITKSLIASTHPSYYRMHKYWSRKPYNIIQHYIKHFTSPGDIVVDPFLGSGVTFIESLLLGRKSIGLDINPISKHIVDATMLDINNERLIDAFNKLKNDCQEPIQNLFYTIVNGKKFNVSHVVWESFSNCPNCNSIIYLFESIKSGPTKFNCSTCSNKVRITSSMVTGERMTEIWYTDEYGNRISKKSDSNDITIFNEICSFDFDCAINDNFMFRSKRTLVHNGMGVKDLFTLRNLNALSLLKNRINNLNDEKAKIIFDFVFTGSVAQGSKLIAYRNGLKSGGPAWTVSGFWIPRKHFEINPWDSFTNRFKKVVKGKLELSNLFSSMKVNIVDSFDKIDENLNCGMLKTTSVTNMETIIPDESIDYIFTDPPYGDSVPYLEYSTIWNAWLNEKAYSDDEIIISDSEVRSKNINSYSDGLKKGMFECFRILKKGKWMSLTFNNRDFNVWNALIQSINAVGFEIVNAVYQVPAVIPAKAQLSKSGSGVGDIIINIQKPNNKLKTYKNEIEKKEFNKLVLDVASTCIGVRGGSASTDQINRSVILNLLSSGILNCNFGDLNKILNSKFNFSDGIWQFKDLSLIKNYEQLSSKIEKIIDNCHFEGVFDRKKIIQAVFNDLSGSNTPELSEIIQIIDDAPCHTNSLKLFD